MLDGIELVIGRQEEQGRVALDVWVHRRNVISCPVNLAKDDVLIFLLNLFGNFFEDGVKLFAMSAPGSVDKQDCVLLDAVNDGVVVVGDNDLDGAGIVCRNRLRFGVR